MGQLNLRDVDDATIERISSLARRHGRSIEVETLTLIEKALAVSGRPPEGRSAAARRIAAMTPRTVTQTDSVTLIREDRDR